MEQDRLEPFAVDEREAARLCGNVSRSTLRAWRSQQRGPRFVRLGRRVVYKISDLRSFLDKNVEPDGRV